ncbi:integrase arm-type DNA-binding domain-containing protein [Alphaproteobacteria bacterium]|nr:integrase arm-type DNA-binding domain-containing protein [Alphaproteobacteria bacterium]
MTKKHPNNELTTLKVKKLTIPGRYADGNNLYLEVDKSGARRWTLRVTILGRRRDMGLGGISTVSLEEARELAYQYRKIARSGGDPILERQKNRGLQTTLIYCTKKVHEINLPTWKNEKFAKQWLSSLEHHVFPAIGKLPISQVTSADILRVLTPIWNTKGDTAKKIKQRLRMIIKWARAQGYFQGDDPVELAEQALPKQLKSNDHHKSLEFEKLPEMISNLRKSKISLPTKLALEFTILSACRTSEVLEAKWEEIDLTKLIWSIPSERMKGGKVHQVPLTDRMTVILNDCKKLKTNNNLLFPSEINGEALSNNTMRLALKKRLNVDATVHGMRSSFKDWASETTNFANEVSEMALAHTISNKTELAYRRRTLIEKRRQLMKKWSDYLNNKEGEVIELYKTGKL